MQDVQSSIDAGQATGANGAPPPPSEFELSLANWVAQYLPEHPLAAAGTSLAIVIAVALVIHFLVRHVALRMVTSVIKRSPTWWDDVLVQHKTLHRIAPIAPLLVFYRGVALVPGFSPELISFFQRITMATMVIVAVGSLSALLTAINDIYCRYPVSRGRPIKGYLQVVKIIAFIAAGIIAIATLMDQSPLFFLSGLGAMTAVILLIFRDTLLSLVAGIQLTTNDLIRVGDWIEMPQFNADGDVVDISLNVVKVQNWDKTVTVIPAHKFLEHSFKNWRAMFETGGRRIKRSIYIDMNTIRFLTPDEIRKFCRFLVLKQYMQQKVQELDEYNRTQVPAEMADILANGRHLSNIGTLRAYIAGYLRRHPKIHQELTFLVRQLQPTPHGLPLEIYVFTNDTKWANYESIQADIFDHILAIIPEFGLRVYQEPAGSDLAQLGSSFQPLRNQQQLTAASTAANGHEES